MADLPWYLTYLSLLSIIWARYVVAAGGFHLFVWARAEDRVGGTRLARLRPAPKTVWREAQTSMAVSFIYAIPATVMIEVWKNGGTALYDTVEGPLGWLWLPVSVVVFLLLHDTYFYWSHRAMHHPRLFESTHRTHHVSKQPTSWAAFCFHPWEAIISSWFVPALAFVVPMHIGVFLFLLTLMTFNSVANHTGWEIWPRSFLDGPIGRHLITARHHNLHHTRFARNYGLYFRFWDRLMRTDDMSGDPMAPVPDIRTVPRAATRITA